MLDWWKTIDLISQIFLCIAVPATMVLIIQTILAFVGMGSEADGDIDSFDGEADVEGDVEAEAATEGFSGLRVLTVRGVIAFFVIFGWTGFVMSRGGCKLWLTAPVALVAGLVMMLLLALLMRGVMKLRSDGTINNSNAMGKSGKVYLTVPAERAGRGKVNVLLQGAYVERDAVTDEKEPIPTGSEVVIVGLSGETDVVVKRK